MNIEKTVEDLKNNVFGLIRESFPYDYEGHTVHVDNLSYAPPKNTTLEAEDSHFLTESTYQAQVRGDLIIMKGDDEVVLNQKDILITNVPYPTKRGTYIIGGNENVFINQMLLREGVYVKPKRNVGKKDIVQGEVRAGKKRFTITYDTTDKVFYISDLGMNFGYQGRKVDAIAFLLFMGINESEIRNAIGDDQIADHAIKIAKRKSMKHIHDGFFDTEMPESKEELKEQINEYLNNVLAFNERAESIQELTIGKGFSSFTPEAFLQTMKQLAKEDETPGSTPLTDDIRFKEILNGEAVIAKGVEKGLFEWTKKVKERIRRNNIKPSNVRPIGYLDKELKGIYNSNLAEMVDSSNPLDLAQKKRKLTMSGPGGLNDRAVTEANRNLLESEFGKIDPIETPQSSKLGVTQHLAQDAEIVDGEIYSKFYSVNNGMIDTSNVVGDIDTFDEYDEYIAFHDLAALESDNGKLQFKDKEVRVRHQGEFKMVPVDQVTLVDIKPDSHLGRASALVPFASHNDGARMLMGSSMQRQALPLENADAPIVQSIGDATTGKTMEELVSEENSNLLKSPTSGVVSRIAPDFIEITKGDGDTVKIDKLNYHSPGKSGAYINHKPVVAVGDKVNEGDLLADGWQSKGGKLALGKNTMIALLPFDGYNHEDGVVVSESWARDMASEELKTLEYVIEYDDDKTYPKQETKGLLKNLMVSDGILSKLDNDGVIKKGSEVTSGDIFVGVVGKKDQSNLTLAERVLRRSINEDPTDRLRDASKYAKGYQRGKVIDVHKGISDNQMKVTVKLLTLKEMGEGDKISGRHGNKGTISKVLPDDEMPRTEDGQAMDLLFSPLAVPSRKNVGQLLEVNAGLVAQKKGLESYNVQNFDLEAKDKLMKELEEIGSPEGKMNLINPKTGKPYENPVTVGPMYIMRLDHNAESKIAATSFGAEDPVTGLPRKLSGAIDGDRTSPQAVGDMEFWSLTSAGAVHNIHEMTTLKSDGSGSAEDKSARLNIFNAIKHGTPIPEPATPQTIKVLQDQFLGAGIQMTALKDGKETTIDSEFTELMLQPMKPEVIKQLAQNEVEVAKTFDSRTGKEDPKGLYSENTFGKDGEGWGKISLETPIPNPIFLSGSKSKPYEAMLLSKGISNKDLIKVVEDGHFIVLDPMETNKKKYDIITSEEYEMLYDIEMKDIHAVTGPSALNELLQGVNLEDELRIAESNLKIAAESTHKDALKEQSDAEKHVKTLSRALDNDYSPTDFLMPFVPVLPVKYRQPVQGGSSENLMEDGITLLYQQLMKRNSEYQKALNMYDGDKSMLDKQTLSEIESDRYKTIKNIIGTETFSDPQRGIEYEGILSKMKSKRGFIRSKLQSKTQNYSGRSVIISEPELDMDEVGIPEDMAAEIFKPHIHKELQKQRFNAKEINKIMEERNKDFRSALSKVAEDEVVILNRQPSLHRHSLQGFNPVIRWDTDGQKSKAIGLNAIVTTAFAADFDGDTMSVHVPITDEAKAEVREKMMPSKNLLNPTSNSIITELKHEMQLGIYYLTRNKMPEGNPRDFKNYEELSKAYFNGDIRTYESARVDVRGKGLITSTTGKHLFNSVLPSKFINYKDHTNMKKKQIEALLTEIIDDTAFGPPAAVKVINALKTLGFKSSTMSGMSIGVRDFEPLADVDKDKLFQDAEKELTSGTNVANFIDKKDEFEIEKARFVESKMDEMLKSGILGEDNPVNITLQSGARGGSSSYLAIGGLVGPLRNVSSEDIRPMKSSLLEGSRPDEFWDLANDSRKGIFDRSVATSGPGELSRSLWTSNKHTIITEKDCGDKSGIILNITKPSDSKGLYGRVLLDDVPLKGGGIIKKKLHTPLTRKQVDKIRKDAENPNRIRVRSPLSCKSKEGLCQNCYGMRPGAMRNELVQIGEPVGSIASQGIGEPAQQSIMKTFHTGGGGNELSSAFEGTSRILELSKPSNRAIVVTDDAYVKEIINDPIKGTMVVTSDRRYDLKHLPISDSVKVGVELNRGDVLTKLKDSSGKVLTELDPADVLKYSGVKAAQTFLTEQLEESFEMGGIDHIDRRHSEVVVSNMTNRGIVSDGGTSGLRPSQVFDRRQMEAFNTNDKEIINTSLGFSDRQSVIGAKAAEDYREGIAFGPIIVKKGEVITEEMWEKLRKNRKFVKVHKKNVSFTPTLQGIGVDNTMHNDNWLEYAGKADANQFIRRGAGEFAVDKLDNPLTQRMTGRKGSFGSNFTKWMSDMKDRYGDTLI